MSIFTFGDGFVGGISFQYNFCIHDERTKRKKKREYQNQAQGEYTKKNKKERKNLPI